MAVPIPSGSKVIDVSCPHEEVVRSPSNNTPYHSLCSSCQQIRLCRILEDDPTSGEIRLEVTVASLKDDSTRYKCLSYVWGAPTPTIPLVLSELTWNVRRGLHAALRRLQERKYAGFIWIDAICIDQENDLEKTAQVALMGRIFGKAEDVFVWLGEVGADHLWPDDEARSGAAPGDEGVDELAEAVSIVNALAENRHLYALPCFTDCGADTDSAVLKSGGLAWGKALDRLETLLQANWFERTWTIQEIVLAVRATVVRGPVALPWATLATAWAYWQEHSNTCCERYTRALSLVDFKRVQKLANQVNMISAAQWKLRHGQPLHCLLLDFRCKEATDGRDKVYGLLSLQSDDAAVELSADYTLSLREAYVCCAIEIMRSQRWLLPLFLELEHNVSGLPSWVPDWTMRFLEPPAFFTARLECVDTYASHLGLHGDLSILRNDVLMVTAIKLDTIERVSVAQQLAETMVEQLRLLDDWLRFAECAADEHYVGNGLLRDAFAATMFGGRYREDGVFRPMMAEDLVEWDGVIADMRHQLREYGPRAQAKLHAAITSQHIAGFRRRLCVTSSGYVGLCPEVAAPGDDIFVVLNGPAPLFLRPCVRQHAEQAQYHVLLGHGYVHGMMDGEAVEMQLPVTQLFIQ